MILTNVKSDGINLQVFINDLIRSDRIGKLLLVVPTNRKIRQLKKMVIDNTPGNSVTKINLHTLTTLSTEMLGCKKRFSELSEASAGVLIKKSTEKVELKYFTNYGNNFPSGSLKRIKNVFSKYKETGITPEVLENISSDLSHSEKLKALDLSAIFNNYLQYTRQLNAFELGDIYSELNIIDFKEFEGYFRDRFPDVEYTIFTGFTEFSPLERSILFKIGRCSNNKCFLEFDNYEYNSNIFSDLKKNVDLLEGEIFHKIDDLSEDLCSPFQKHIRTRLFKFLPDARKTDFSSRVKVIRSFDREAEVEVIAKEVKQLINRQNIDPSRICVVFNLIENYSNLLRFAFTQKGIPFNLTDRISLSDTYPVSAIINFLEIALDDFYYKNIIRAFQSGFIDLPEIDVSNILTVGVQLKVVKGYNNWKNSIETALNTNISDESESFRLSETQLKKALKDIDSLNQLLSPFKNKMSIPQFLKEFYSTIKKLKIPGLLIQNPSDDDEKNIKAFTTFLNVTSEIFNLLGQDYGENARLPLGFYLDQIKTACREGRFNTKEKNDYGVLITTLNEIRGLKFDYLIIGGLVDGDLPTRFTPEIFFAEQFARKEHEHITEERYLFYQALSTWEKGLVLTVPASDQNRELSESTFLKDFLKITECEERLGAEYKNLVFSTEELHTLSGKLEEKKLQEVYLKYLDDGDGAVDRLIKNIGIDKERQNSPESISNYNGYLSMLNDEIDDPSNIGAKIKSKLSEFINKEFSASELEIYAKCPFKYFLERVVNLKIEAEPSEEVEAFEMGSLVHTILYEFYSELKKNNIKLYNCSDKVFNESKELIFRIAKSRVEKSFFNSPFSFFDIEKLLGIEGNQQQSILYRFLEFERANDDGFEPRYFETSFGRTNQDQVDTELSTKLPVEINGVKLKGKIDRIEMNDDNSAFAITDYKSRAKIPPKNDFEEGLSLQLPLYLMAAKVLLTEKFDKEIKPAFIQLYGLQLNMEEFGKKKIKYGRGDNFDYDQFNLELIENVQNKVKSYVDSISGGVFPLSKLNDRQKKVCLYCDFKRVCRVEEIR